MVGAIVTAVSVLGACSSPQGEMPRDDIAALDEARNEDASPGSRGKAREGGRATGGKTKPEPAGGGSGGAGSGGGGGTTSSGGGGGSDEGGGPGGSGGTQAAVAAPIPEGRYAYSTDGERNVSGNEEPMPETTTLAAAAPSDGIQRQTRDLRDDEGNGVVTETDLLYRPDGVYLSYVKITSRFQGGLTDVREFRLPRPEPVAPRGAGPGAARSFTMEGSGTWARVAIEAQRYEDVSAGGGRVRTLVVETVITFSGALEGRQRSVTWFWPRHLMPVREQVQTDVRNGPIRLQSDYVAVVDRLP